MSRLSTSALTSKTGTGGGVASRGPDHPDRPGRRDHLPVPSPSAARPATAAGSVAALIAATVRAARVACPGSIAVSSLSSCPTSLARARWASVRARPARPARSASSAASAAHQGEPGGTGLVARAASRRAKLDNVPPARARARAHGLSSMLPMVMLRHRPPRLALPHRTTGLASPDLVAKDSGPGWLEGSYDRPAQMAVNAVEGQIQTPA